MFIKNLGLTYFNSNVTLTAAMVYGCNHFDILKIKLYYVP